MKLASLVAAHEYLRLIEAGMNPEKATARANELSERVVKFEAECKKTARPPWKNFHP